MHQLMLVGKEGKLGHRINSLAAEAKPASCALLKPCEMCVRFGSGNSVDWPMRIPVRPAGCPLVLNTPTFSLPHLHPGFPLPKDQDR